MGGELQLARERARREKSRDSEDDAPEAGEGKRAREFRMVTFYISQDRLNTTLLS